MIRIAIIVGSTRPGRAGEAVARWVHEIAKGVDGATFDLVDLREFALPLLDEPGVPMIEPGQQEHTRRWAEAVASFDGYVFVTPEYNHGAPAALKNGLDLLYAEWSTKAAGFVSYGSEGGVRAVEQLRQVMGQLRIADVTPAVPLALGTDFVDFRKFAPQQHRADQVTGMVTELVAWAGALRGLRTA